MPMTELLRRNAGTTLVELMIAVAIFSGGMALLSGTVITFASHNVISEEKAQATTFGNSVIEDIRGLEIEDIINYEVPVDDPDKGTVFISGMGEARVAVYAVIPDPDTQYAQWYELGGGGFPEVETLPNPIEIIVKTYDVSSGYGGEGGVPRHYSVSTMISY